MEIEKVFLMSASRKRRRGSRFLGRRLVQNNYAARKDFKTIYSLGFFLIRGGT